MYTCIVEVLNTTSGNQSSFLCSEILTLHPSVNSKCKKSSKRKKKQLCILKAQAYVCLGVLMLEDNVKKKGHKSQNINKAGKIMAITKLKV